MAEDEEGRGAEPAGAAQPPEQRLTEPAAGTPGAETQVQPSVPPTVDQPASGRAGTGETSVLPTVRGPDPTPPRWSARAQVPPPGVDQEPLRGAEWDETTDEPSPGLFKPLLITVGAVLLLALVGLSVWLVLRNRDVNPTPLPSSTITPTVSAPTPTPTPTTIATTAAPAPVAIPDLSGMDYDTAADALTELGFVVQRRDEINANVPAGQVIGTDPPAGTQVLPGASIAIIVSAGAPTTEPTSAEPTPTTPT